MNQPLLSVRDLTIAFPCPEQGSRAVVKRVGFDLAQGQSLAIVGESGSGKTMIGKALLGLLPDAATVSGGSAVFNGRDLFRNTPADWRALRGTEIGMVFQEPMVSLNPAFRIGDQLTEGLVCRRGIGRAEARALALAMLERVLVRNPKDCMQRYPHEFSGGMRQRIMLAAVMLLKPKLLIADEPTTALDCVVQKEVLDLMLELTVQEGTALIFVSHNLSLVAEYTERVLVMCRGDAVETGPVKQVLSRPAHDYTLKLLDALPKRDPDAVPPPPKPPILEVRGLTVDYEAREGWFGKRQVRAVHPASFSVSPGETLAIVGESGSGKTTLTKAILGLLKPSGGAILFEGKDLLTAGKEELRSARRRIQMVFQDPYSSLDPRMEVGALVAEGLRLDDSLNRFEREARVAKALEDVQLGGAYAKRYIHELSGGQRQRVAIARALVVRPDIIIADEPVSALDVTVQKQVLDILVQLQDTYGFACLLISHDLGVVEQVSDRVIVMLRGHVVEEGTRDEVFDAPCHPYTQRLLQAVPELYGNREEGFRVETRKLPPARGDLRYFQPEVDGNQARKLVPLRPAGTGAAPHRAAVVDQAA
ncbi:dipeptide ABC transporter ATP-binding protein [Pseudoduganella namucuonensis]|uniref:Peptide/nickel transport system ATP-binding protein n=1 Tax=Pseudoduganella namucuonensis TaxID=1035707 RepID=A0A1I7KSS3_9BURK|nr:ABC transporter ATP-binding protein [Pseudoduganella namucuonensis]SFV00428.1 peptide/nickel transport system ATP-binding protein [Pseudoduganella namucuonensis]